MKLLLAGGRQARDAGIRHREHRSLYDRGILAELDPVTLALTPVLGFDAPRFGAPFADDDGIVLCTEDEVLVLRDGEIVDRWSDPAMDDLHHAARLDGRLVAVSTGRDLMLGRPGETLPLSPSPGRDTVHANHVFSGAFGTWVTRGTAGDVLRLDDGRAVPVAEVCIHDGVPDGRTAWFTAVDGRLLQVDLTTGATVRAVDLHQPDDGPEPLGWCRGLALHEGVAWVGFTRIRATRSRQHLAWVRGRLRGRPVATRRPTRVIGVELATGRRIASVELAPVGIDALFGLALRPPGI